jgi:aspartyl-tRNA(Asn)/glutamyl-tRNA(Gln) amidotransferase subunit B
VNVSIRPEGTEKFGTKIELKNLNSISGVRRALAYEIQRQIAEVGQGVVLKQETRRWDDVRGQTTLMRTKEQAHDYRYFPDPDLQPLRTDTGLLDQARQRLPELPEAKRGRLVQNFGVTDYQAGVLAADRRLSDYFEKAAAAASKKSTVANFLLNDYLALAPDLATLPVPPEYFGELANLLDGGQINGRQAKEVLIAMVAENKAPAAVVKEKGLVQVTDTAQLEKWCQEAIAANPRSVADFKAGKQNAVNALKGYVMKQSKGQASPQTIGEILIKILS